MKIIRRLIVLIFLRIGRGCFLMEDARLKRCLEKRGFHISLCTHPSILFKHQRISISILPIWLLDLICSYLYQNYALLTAQKWHSLLSMIGISDYYVKHMDFVVFQDDGYKEYNVPNKELVGRMVVYTALTGKYDNVHELIYKEHGVDYLLFTNNRQITSKTWQVRYVNSDLDNVLLSREIKMLPHKYVPDYDYSVYIDANAYIYGNIAQLTTLLSPAKSFVVTMHRVNTSIKEEIESCVKCKGISREEVNNQYEKYLKCGFKDNLGLAECGILVRIHNDPKLISLMERWWQEFQNGVKRDQLSLMACIYLEDFATYSIIEGTIYHNQFCIIGGHNNDNEN